MPLVSLSFFLAAVLLFTCLLFTWSEQFTVNQPLHARQILSSVRVCSCVYEAINRPSGLPLCLRMCCRVLTSLRRLYFQTPGRMTLVLSVALFLSQGGAGSTRGRAFAISLEVILPHKKLRDRNLFIHRKQYTKIDFI